MFSLIPSDANDPQGLMRRKEPNKQTNKTSYHYQNNCIYVKIQRSRIIGGTQIITNNRKNTYLIR